jgi:hypothetical protein
MKIVILNKQNLIKSNFLDINMKDNKKNKSNNNKINEADQVANNKQVYFVIEPNEYIRHYDDIITLKVTNVISVIFFAIIFLLFIVVFLLAWDDLWDKCTSKSWIVFLPVMTATFISSLFNFYSLIYSLKHLSWEKSLDISLCNFGIIAGITLYVLSKSRIIKSNGSSYFFFFPYFFLTIGCVIIPLAEIYWSKFFSKKKKVSRTEFIKLLTSKKYIEIIKVYSIRFLCIENILFWELHLKVLKTICSNLYEEIKLIKRDEFDNTKITAIEGNINTTNNIMKSAEFDSSYVDLSSVRKQNAYMELQERRCSTGGNITKRLNNPEFDDNRKMGDSQPFPHMEEAKDSIHYRSENNFENATYSVIMDPSFNVNIFNITGNSSNIYSSESTELSVKNSQSIDIKLNSESSEIKRIIFDQIFRELVIPEDLWNAMFKRMNNFNDEYIEYYKKIYDIYINPKGVVPVKLKNNSAKSIGLKISKSEYSYDMFFPILDEVATLIYEHVYLNLVF